MKSNDVTGHLVGVLLVLAMLSCAAAFSTGEPTEAEASAFEVNAMFAP